MIKTFFLISLLIVSYSIGNAISSQFSNYFRPRMRSINSPDFIQEISLESEGKKYILFGGTVCSTSEFYNSKFDITRNLIENHGFNTLFFEGEWLEWSVINRYLNSKEKTDFKTVLKQNLNFWPSWRWKNNETLEFLSWLRDYIQENNYPVNVYGTNFYDIRSNLAFITEFLVDHYPLETENLINTLNFFEDYDSEWSYAHTVNDEYIQSVSQDLVELKSEILNNLTWLQKEDQKTFNLLRHTLANIITFEEYLVKTLTCSQSSWNRKINHKYELINAIEKDSQSDLKIIVFANNNITSAADATEMYHFEQISLGQKLREESGFEKTLIIGMTSYQGIVIKADYWGDSPSIVRLPSARNSSLESLLFHTNTNPYYLVFTDSDRAAPLLQKVFSQRNLPVIFDIETEQIRNYMPILLPFRYDILLFFPTTRAVNYF